MPLNSLFYRVHPRTSPCTFVYMLDFASVFFQKLTIKMLLIQLIQQPAIGYGDLSYAEVMISHEAKLYEILKPRYGVNSISHEWLLYSILFYQKAFSSCLVFYSIKRHFPVVKELFWTQTWDMRTYSMVISQS